MITFYNLSKRDIRVSLDYLTHEKLIMDRIDRVNLDLEWSLYLTHFGSFIRIFDTREKNRKATWNEL